jgi:hypothetical protein
MGWFESYPKSCATAFASLLKFSNGVSTDQPVLTSILVGRKRNENLKKKLSGSDKCNEQK